MLAELLYFVSIALFGIRGSRDPAGAREQLAGRLHHPGVHLAHRGLRHVDLCLVGIRRRPGRRLAVVPLVAVVLIRGVLSVRNLFIAMCGRRGRPGLCPLRIRGGRYRLRSRQVNRCDAMSVDRRRRNWRCGDAALTLQRAGITAPCSSRCARCANSASASTRCRTPSRSWPRSACCRRWTVPASARAN